MVTNVQKQGEHSYSLLIDGVPFKAVDNVLLDEQAKSFDKLQKTVNSLTAQLQAADKQIADQTATVQALKEKVTVKEQERDEARSNLQDAKGLIAQQRQSLDQEIAFRHDAVQMVPHGNVSGFGGKLLKMLDSPYFQFSVKVAAPIASTIGVYTRSARCP